MSTLRERMDRLCEVFTAQVPAEIKAVMSGATEDLCASDTARLELENLSGIPAAATSAQSAPPTPSATRRTRPRRRIAHTFSPHSGHTPLTLPVR